MMRRGKSISLDIRRQEYPENDGTNTIDLLIIARK
jgi:hypothetical protein